MLTVVVAVVPVFFGVLKVLLVMSRFEKVALDDPDDAGPSSLTRRLEEMKT